MACCSSLSSLATSKEQTNCIRLCKLIFSIGRSVLQDAFDSIHPPTTLSGLLSSSTVYTQLRTLRGNRKLYSDQWIKLYPPTGSAVHSSNFDISLLSILLRNICGICAPASTGSWDVDPTSTDVSKGADIVRIKKCRNKLAHINDFSMSDADFENMWNEIADSLIRLGGQKYQEIIQRQKIDSIDSEDASHHLSLLQSWENRDDVLLEEMRKVALGASNSNSKAEILIRGIIKIVTAGGIVLAFAAGSAFFLNRYQNDPDTIIDLVQGAIIPASVATGLAVKEILKGSFIIKVQVSSMEALMALWESYLRGDLSQKLQEVIITEELSELAPKDHHQILIDVTISEEEIKQAQISLIKKEKDISAFDMQKGGFADHEDIETNTNLRAMSGNDSDSSDEDLIVISLLAKDVVPKKVNGLMTADLSSYDVISEFPNFSNNLQVIRMPTRMLKSPIPDSFCQMKCLKELFLYGDALRSEYGLSSLPLNFGNLKTLEVLNLERNCFSKFPEQICDLINLEKLYLNGCGLTSISPKIKHLKNLLELDFSDNNFSSGLCPELFELQSLKDLYLMNCSLTSLPEEIGNLRFLEGLRLIDNELTEFPEQLYTMKYLKKLAATKNRITQISPSIVGLQSLKVLSLGENMLTFLPNEISKLPALKLLNVFGNRLTCLPESIIDLNPPSEIVIHENHFLQKPPLSICSKGIDSIRGYFSSMAKSDKLHSNRIKIIMLGEAGAGKTFLTHALVNCKARETENNDSTIGVEMHHCPLGEDEGERLEACIVDCAGQRRYQLTHPFFLSEESLHIIVVNLKTYQTTKKSESESFKKYVEDWIDWVTARLLKPRIMIVGTHRDELSYKELSEKCSDILKRIEKHEQRAIQRLESEIKLAEKREFREKDREGAKLKEEDLKWFKNNRPILSSRVLLGDDSECVETEKHQEKENEAHLNLVAVASTEELKGMILLRNEICRVARCRTSSGKKEDALFPLVGIDLPTSWLNLEKAIIEYRRNCKASEVPCMTMEQFEKFAHKEAGLEGSEVVSGLNYLDSVGEIKFYERNIPRTQYSVFLDLPWLCKLVKLLFRHDYEEDDAIEFKDEYSDCGMERIKFELHLKDLKEGGRLSLDLLKCFWLELKLTENDIFNMIRSLVVFGLACEIPFQNEEFFIPWFLHSELDSKEKQEIFPDVPESDKIELRLKFSIVGYLPTGVFHRLCVRCYSLGIDVTTWKNSMLIYKNDTQIYLEVIDSEITVTGRSPETDIKLLWSAILGIVKELRQLLSEWPRIVYNTYTVCPKCIKRKAKRPYHFPRKWWKEENFDDARCKEKRSEVIEASLLVPPPEVLERQDAPLVPVAVSSFLARDLSQRLPEDWETLGTYLGLPDYEIANIKINHAGNVTEMAYAMFNKWGQLKGKEATTSTLIDALKKTGREDLVNFVRESIY